MRGAPIERSECTVHGTGTRGPWSGPTYTWDPPVSSNASAVGATLDNTSETTNTLRLNILKAGDTTVSVTGHVGYSSSCGDATGQDTAIINVHVSGKVWDVGEAISGGEVSTASGETDDGGAITVVSGATVDLQISEATDSDHWKKGSDEGTDDDTLKYTWTTMDIPNSGTLSQSEGLTSTWTAPTLPAIISSENRAVTVTINDTPKALGAGEGGTRDDENDTVKRKIVFHIVHQGNSKNWSATPALSPGIIVPSSQVVHPGQRITINIVSASDSDTWTMSDGKQGTQADLGLKYKWNPGFGKIMDGAGTNSIVWEAPMQMVTNGIAIGCEVDDSLSANQTGVTAPETGTRNDAPVLAPGVTLQMTSSTCGYYKHTSWDVAPGIEWTESAQGYPEPTVPQATEHADFDNCSGANSTTNQPETQTFDYKLLFDHETKDADGTTYREVTYQAMSRYGGPDSPPLKDKRPITRTWSATPGLSGGEVATPGANAVVQAGQTISLAVGAAHDSDTWTRGSYSTTVADAVRYTWSGDAGSFDSTSSAATHWTAPAAADVPAGSEGLSVTLTCDIDDKWQGEETGVTLPDKGTRNDTTGLSRSVTVKVVRQPCGQWKHKSWSETQPLQWQTDGNGDPEPIAPAALTETVSWQDDCGGTTQPDQTRTVAYTQTQDESVKDENGVWQRAVKYQAFSSCPGGEEAPALSGQSALPRHWTTPGELDGGTITVTVAGVPDAPPIAPTTPGQAITVTIPTEGSVGFVVNQAKDTDTYTYREVPEQVSPDTITYHWKLNGGSEAAPMAEVDLGTGSGAALPSQPALPPGSYTVSCEVDDSSAGAASGVSAPDLGNRNDEPKSYSVSVKIVGKVWDAGTALGKQPIFNEDGSLKKSSTGAPLTTETGRMLAPQDQRDPNADQWKPAPIYVRPGQSLDCAVEEAVDSDHWTQELPSTAPGSAGAANRPPYQDWVADTVRYRWSVEGPNTGGPAGSFANESSAVAQWTAPAAQAGVDIVGTYTLKCTLSDPWSGENKGVTPPKESGTRDDADVVRTVQVIVRESDSYAELKVLPSDETGNAADAEKQGAVGGKLWGQLNVTVGINQKLDSATTGVVARVEETDTVHAGQTSPLPYFDKPISFTQDWEHLQDRDANGALLPQAQWQWVAGGSPTQLNDGDFEVQYRQRFPWDSTKQPLGHNGNHQVSLRKDGEATQLRFVKVNGDTYESGPSSHSVDVENLVITGVSTSNGTEDYFKFNADSTDETLTHPEIKFTIKDEGDPHVYRWRVRVRSTDDANDSKSVAYEDVASSPGEITVKINDATLAGEGSPLPSITETGSYNFEIRVFEYPTTAAAQADIAQSALTHKLVDTGQIDVMNNRSNYLVIPYFMEPPYQSHVGHDGRIVGDRDDDSHHWLMSHYFKDTTHEHQALKVKITILDPDLKEIAAPELDYKLNWPTFDRDVYHFPIQGFQEGRYYIGVTTAKDDHGADYRDHKARSILAKNNRSLKELPKAEWKGDNRACAGGSYLVTATERAYRDDDAHVALFKAQLLTEIGKPETALANQRIQLRFKSKAGADPALFVIRKTGGEESDNAYTSDTIQTTTDAQGYVTVEVLSSRKIGTAEIIVSVEVEVPPVAAAPKVAGLLAGEVTPAGEPTPGYAWKDLKETWLITFDKPEGKRLFGRVDRFISDASRSFDLTNRFWLDDFTYDNDNGWNFEPLVLQRIGNPDVPSSIIKCQFFLRFRKDTDDKKVDKNYFAFTQGTPPNTTNIAAVPALTNLDTNGNKKVDEAEWDVITLRATEITPLVNSLPDATGDSRKLWFGVPKHTLRFKITNILQSESGREMIPPLPGLDPRTVSFCDEQGNYLQIKASGDPQMDTNGRPVFGRDRPTQVPNFMPADTSNSGAVTFYLRGGFLSQRMNEIKLSVEDTTTK